MRYSVIIPPSKPISLHRNIIFFLTLAALLYPINVRADLNTVAGPAQSNAIGQLLITFTGADGQPENQEFSVYFPGPKPKVEDVVHIGQTEAPTDLVADTYDIKIPVHPTLWMKQVVIEQGKTTHLDVGGYGRIRIKAEDKNGDPLIVGFSVFKHDGEKEFVIEGFTNTPSGYILTGVYDIEVDTQPTVTFDAVEIIKNNYLDLTLPKPGSLEIRGNNALGEPLKFNRGLIYKPNSLAYLNAEIFINHPKELQPGLYDIVVDIDPEFWFRGVEVVSGESRTLKLPAMGRLMVQGKDKEGAPLLGYDYSIHESKNEQKQISDGDINVAKNLIPDVYDIKVNYKPEIWFKNVKIAAGKIETINVPPPSDDADKISSVERPSAQQGRIKILGTNALSEPLEGYYGFYVYPSGDRARPIAESSVKKPVDLAPGVYDVLVDIDPDVLFESVTITADEIKELNVSLPGRLEVIGKNALGEKHFRKFLFSVYPSGNRETRLAYWYVNYYKDLPEGVYDVHVNTNPEIWFENIELSSEKHKKIELPMPGRLEIRAHLSEKVPQRTSYTVFPSGKKDKPIIKAEVNNILEIQPGRYDIIVQLSPENVVFENIKISERQSKVIDITNPQKPKVSADKTGKIEKGFTGPRGILDVQGKTPEGTPLHGVYFFVYNQGEKIREKHIAFGDVNVPKDLPPGTYDLEVTLEPRAWYKSVEIIENARTTIDLSQLGKLTMQSLDADGEPLNTAIFVYIEGERESPVSVGYVNKEENLRPGTYDIEVALDPHAWFEGIELKGGQTTMIDLPQTGKINIHTKTIGTEPLKRAVWFYAPGDRETTLTFEYTNIPRDLWEGTYDIVINLDRHVVYEGVKILSGQSKTIELDEIAYVQLTAVAEDQGEPFEKTGGWFIHHIGEDDKPETEYSAVDFSNPSKQFVLPTGQYVAKIRVRRGSAEVKLDLKAGDIVEKSVVVNADAEAELRLDKSVFTPGEEMAVHFVATADFNQYAWVGIIPSHIEHGDEFLNDEHDIAYQYLNGQPSGTVLFTAPQTPGQYDFRVHTDNLGGREAASVSFTVVGKP